MPIHIEQLEAEVDVRPDASTTDPTSDSRAAGEEAMTRRRAEFRARAARHRTTVRRGAREANA